MTLEEAKKISGLVTDIFAQKPRNGYLRESQLCGYSLFDIHHAYALVIALRRQSAAYDPNLKSEIDKYADLAAGLVVSIPAMVLPDQEAARLAQIPNESDEYKRIKMGIIVKQINRWNLDPVWGKQEALDSFNKFCWLLDPKNILYWQKVYTHLGLPYDSDSPKGMPDLTFDENARESWVVPQNIPNFKSNVVKVFLLIAGVIAMVWFLIKH
jgi:hypothetical protein